MRKAYTLLWAAVLGMSAMLGTALHAQTGVDLRSLSPNTVVGRLGSGRAGPAQAIPITQLGPTINATSFGCVADTVPGVSNGTDNSVCLQAAINSLPASGGTVFLPHATTAGNCYGIAATVKLGNGTGVVESTTGNIRLIGEAGGFDTSYTKPQTGAGASCIYWTGAQHGTMLQIAGPSLGSGIWDIHLQGASQADTLLDIEGNAYGYFRFSGAEWIGTGIILKGTPAPGIAYGACGNIFVNVNLAPNANSTANGLLLDGDTVNGPDACSNLFFGGWIEYGGGANTYGVKLVYADNNSFYRTNFQTFGGSGHDYVFAQAASPQTEFPAANLFIGTADTHGCSGTTGTGAGNVFLARSSTDSNGTCSLAGMQDFQGNSIWNPDPSKGLSISSTVNIQHLNGYISAPTANSCAGFSLATGGSDLAGDVTFTSATTCSITFGQAFVNAPTCVLTGYGTTATLRISAISNTGFTVTGSTAFTQFGYACIGG